ncbi:MAG: chloride channel protein [Planctomycetota bacterium]|nr:chloride channel protein [Planctomycetota bacterium]
MAESAPKTVHSGRNWTALRDRLIPTGTPLTISLSCVIGIAAGYGAVIFNALIARIASFSVQQAYALAVSTWSFWILLAVTPAIGLLLVAWITRRFAREAQGHGVPEVISAVAHDDGIIRPRVALVKVLASALCIGTGGSVGREGPIVQIGAALGSLAGQIFDISPRHLTILVAAGAGAGISATFNAPLAGVMFASEIILGSFAVESLAPIVIACVLAQVIHVQASGAGWWPAFGELRYEFLGDWGELPSYILFGMLCGLVAVSFTKMLYRCEDLAEKKLTTWWKRALLLGLLVGVIGVGYELVLPRIAPPIDREIKTPALFGVGYEVVHRALRMQNDQKPVELPVEDSKRDATNGAPTSEKIPLDKSRMQAQLFWFLPLVLLKPLLTSLTLAGGGSGGIFAPSLFLGASLGTSFGLICNLLFPDFSANPGVYAIVGMGAVVAGTTHGLLSAILIVYEMTGDYRIILPIMIAAGLSSWVSRYIDPESIYMKKLARRGETLTRGLDMQALEHVRVRDVMIQNFPTVSYADTLEQIIGVARSNLHIESLPVMDADETLIGIIRAEDLHRVLDADLEPHLVNAEDIVMKSRLSVSPEMNLLEAMRDFGSWDVETLPVETHSGSARRLVGLLLRADVLSRYRREMLRAR